MKREDLIEKLEQVAAAQEELEKACAAFGIDSLKLDPNALMQQCKELGSDRLDYVLSLLDKINSSFDFVEEDKSFREMMARMQEVKGAQ